MPVPGRGHWAKLAHRHTEAKKPPLPKLDKVPVIYRCGCYQKPVDGTVKLFIPDKMPHAELPDVKFSQPVKQIGQRFWIQAVNQLVRDSQ